MAEQTNRGTDALELQDIRLNGLRLTLTYELPTCGIITRHLGSVAIVYALRFETGYLYTVTATPLDGDLNKVRPVDETRDGGDVPRAR